jgi:catechol 2,3-dioxygenase
MADAMETTRGSQKQTRDFFRPRRLGHANLFVSDYLEAQQFYYSVAGINEAYRQPDNKASFISNGNTYHDFGLTDVRSPYAPKGQRPGLYHIAFELETEVDLVEGYNRAVANGVKFSHTRDHDVAHSCYLRDPDDNMVEIYADVRNDWQTSRRGIIIRKKPEYIPGVTSPPVDQKNYPLNPDLTFVDDAVFRSKRSTHVGLVTDKMSDMFSFYTDVVGLTPFVGDASGRYAVLRGTYGSGDITLLANRPGLEQGLHHVGIEVENEANLDQALQMLPKRGIKLVRHIEHPARRAITVHDSSGILLQFYVNRDWRPQLVSTVGEDDAPYLL